MTLQALVQYVFGFPNEKAIESLYYYYYLLDYFDTQWLPSSLSRARDVLGSEEAPLNRCACALDFLRGFSANTFCF